MILHYLTFFCATVCVSFAASCPNIDSQNGRMPCDRNAGGISHCSGTKFVCKDGRVSKSKKTCCAEVYGQSE